MRTITMYSIITKCCNFSVLKRTIGIFVFLLFTFLFQKSFAQWINVNPPSGGFAIDGGLRANTPNTSPFAANQGDWYPGLAGSGTGGSVFDASGNPFNSLTSGRRTDLASSNVDNVFASGSKFNDYVSSLKWSNSGALDKGDINNALYHVSRDLANKQWVFIAGDRSSTNGTSYIDFEFLQGDIIKNSDGTFTGVPALNKNSGGGRTENDVIASMEYTSGGTVPNVFFYQWKKTGSTWSWVQFTPPSGTAFAETNRAPENNLPYTAFGLTSYPDSLKFLEAAINITALISGTSSACEGLNIKTLWIKTKASAVSTAALKDFIDPISVNFNFEGTTTINNIDNYCSSDNTTYTLSGTPAGGTFKVDGVTATTFSPSTAGAGDHTVQYTVSGCTASKTFHVIANPTALVLTGSSICSSAPNTGTVTSSTSGAATVSYQLYNSSNQPVQSAKSGTGGSLQWTGLAAASGYYVIATGAAPTSCTSTSNSVDVTSVTNPTALVLTGSSICSSAPNTGTVTSSTSGAATVSYQLYNSSNQPVQSAKSGTGGSLQWTGLAAASGYYVIATGAAPTSCTSTSNSVDVTSVTNPTALVLTGSSICSSAPNTGTVTSSTSGAATVSYQLYNSSNQPVQSAKSGTGGSLQWTGLAAASGYYVIATGAAPTSCTSTSNSVDVTSVTNPTALVLTGSSICSSAPNTGTVTSSTSGAATVSYQLYNSSNQPVQSAKSGTGGSLQWTGLAAASGYYVIATGAAPTSCTSTSNSVDVTSVTNPTALVLTGSSICSSAPNTGTVTSSTSGAATVSYQLYNSSNQPVQSAKSGTGGSLQWTGLAAASGYYVIATGAAPTSCTSTSNSVDVTSVTNPTALVLTGSSICSSAPNTGTVTSSTSGAATVSYQLYNSSNQPVQSAKSGTGGSLQWTGLAAASGYYVIATGAAPTSCTSTSNSVNVSSVTNPDQPQVTIIEPSLCGAATATLTVTNPKLGATYTLTQDAGGINPTPVEYNGGTLSFPGLIPGKHFYIVANVGACSSAQTNCGNYLPAPSTLKVVDQVTNNLAESLPTVKAYPNPFTDRVKFVVNSPGAGNGSLEIYNIMGQKVKTVYQGYINAGDQSFDLSVPKKQQSTLIYIFKVNGKQVTGKLLQLKN